ncbi:hypothetical protein ACH5BF_10360 [Arcobacter sp. YIC-464]|uniref:hypothetical protein n=1 Tax=Arcobacter sp. YIC-464 TaxID=3376631 RepID=UPI003C235166
MNSLFESKLKTFSPKQKQDIINQIKTTIPNDINLKFNGNFYPKHNLVLFHLINDYHLAYTKSKKEEKNSRINTLESLGKGNKKRKDRFEKNKELLKSTSISNETKLTAFYENLILKRILKGDYKFAYLLLTYFYMYQPQIEKLQKQILLFSGYSEIIINAYNKALNFFEFTYLTPQKIVNSCAIAVYQYLKISVPEVSEEERLKFIRSIINTHFSEDAPSSLRANFFEREIYCAGIYNSTPIFQWNTSTKKESYYSEKDIKKLYRMINSERKKSKINNTLLINKLVKKEHRQYIDYFYENEERFSEIIKATSITYVQNPNKLIKILDENYKKTFTDYIKLPFKTLNTIFVALVTKLTLK